MNTRNFGFLLLLIGAVHLGSLASPHAALASNIAIAFASQGAALTCLYCSTRMQRERAGTWRFVSLGLAIWTVAQLVYLWYENVLNITVPTPSVSDFIFFVSGIPILLALTLPPAERGTRIIRLLDVCQALLTTLLLGFCVARLHSYIGNDTRALASRLDQIFTAEGLLIAAVAIARFLCERRTHLSRDFGLLAVFLSIRCVCEISGNAAELYWHIPTGTPVDLLWSAPFLLLSYLIVKNTPAPVTARQRVRRHLRALVENIGPSLLVIPVVLFSIFIARLHPWLGCAAVILSFSINQARATLVQRMLATSEAARLHSEARFRRVFDQAPLGIAMVESSSLRITEANAALGNLLGWSAHELRGKVISDLILSAPNEETHVPLSGENEVRQIERRYRKRNGEVLWAKTTITQLKGEDGTTDIRLGMVEDISAHKRMEAFAETRNYILEMIVGNEPLDAILAALANAVSEHESNAHCLILRTERGQLRQVAASHTNDKTAAVLHHLSYTRIADHDACIWKTVAAAATVSGYHSSWSSVVRSGDNKVLGAISLFFETPQPLSSMGKQVVESAARIVALGLDHDAIHQQLVFRIHHDALTGIANRVLFEDRLQHALSRAQRFGTRVAVLSLDLDNFKQINDTFGHHAGDAVLKEVASRLSARVRHTDTLARISGDEFSIVLTQYQHDAELRAVAAQLLSTLNAPFSFEGKHFDIRASLGVAQYPEGGLTWEELHRSADQALYRAKQKGRGTIECFSPDFARTITAQRETESELRRVLAAGAFDLHYQPQYSCSGELAGLEALLRLPGNSLSPSEFVPIAEQTGLIVPIGNWVLRAACEQWVAWHAAGLAPVPVAVNVSMLQFSQPDFADTIARILRETQMPPAMLELELTESMIMTSVHDSAAQMRLIRQLGVRLSVDDFGTGYSSLSYLYQLPIDALKIDRSFVQNINEQGGTADIVTAIVYLAERLGMRTIAEGVETESQLDLLQSIGCSHVQGFLFSPPMPTPSVRQMLEQRLLCPANA